MERKEEGVGGKEGAAVSKMDINITLWWWQLFDFYVEENF